MHSLASGNTDRRRYAIGLNKVTQGQKLANAIQAPPLRDFLEVREEISNRAMDSKPHANLVWVFLALLARPSLSFGWH